MLSFNHLLPSKRAGICRPIFIVLLLTCCLALPASAVEREVDASPDISKIRPVGSLRVWTFTHDAKDLGRLISEVSEMTEVDGRDALVFKDTLRIDYSEMRIEHKIDTWGERIIDLEGYYLGDDLNIRTAASTEKLHLRVEDETARGYSTRGEREVEHEVALGDDVFGWDVHFLDQLEIWLAMQDIEVGETLTDSLFVPQTLMKTQIVATVDNFVHAQLYKGRFDSVFAIHITHPQPYAAFFTPDKRLVRFDFLNERIKVYQDFVGRSANAPAREEARPETDWLSLLVRCGIFLAVGLLVLAVLAAYGFRRSISYIGLAVGAVLCLGISYIAEPIQGFLIGLFTGSGTEVGGGVYLWWIVPSIAFALLQETVRAGGIFMLFRWLKPGNRGLIAAGAFLGAGFGLYEACSQTATGLVTGVFDMSVLHYSFLVAFHAAAGAVVGKGLGAGTVGMVRMAGVAALVNGLIRYLSVYAWQGTFDAELVYLATALMTIIFLAGVVLLLKKPDEQKIS